MAYTKRGMQYHNWFESLIWSPVESFGRWRLRTHRLQLRGQAPFGERTKYQFVALTYLICAKATRVVSHIWIRLSSKKVKSCQFDDDENHHDYMD